MAQLKVAKRPDSAERLVWPVLVGTHHQFLRSRSAAESPSTWGATFSDRYSVLFRGTLTTAIFVQAVILSANYEVMLSEHVALSTGLGAGLIGGGPDQAAAIAALAPVRATFLLASRTDDQRARRGFALFFELSPGITIVGAAGRGSRSGPTKVPIAVMAAVGASYV